MLLTQQRLPKLPKTEETWAIRWRMHCMDMSTVKCINLLQRIANKYGTGDEVACRLRLGRPKLLRMDEC